MDVEKVIEVGDDREDDAGGLDGKMRVTSGSGNGLLLFFRVDSFEVALPRARTLVSRLEEEPHVNPRIHFDRFPKVAEKTP